MQDMLLLGLADERTSPVNLEFSLQSGRRVSCAYLYHASERVLMLLLLHRGPVGGPGREGVLPVHAGHVLPHQHAQPVAVVVPAVWLHLHNSVFVKPSR